MSYVDMKEKHPLIGDLSPKVEDFMNAWHQAGQYRQQYDAMLKQARAGIVAYYFPREGSHVFFENVELSQSGADKHSVIFPVEYGFHGSVETCSYTIPIEVCLEGQAAVIAFFVEEKAKQQKKADELGQKRAMEEKTQRKIIFDKLKLEFEPPAEAIVKYNDNN